MTSSICITGLRGVVVCAPTRATEEITNAERNANTVRAKSRSHRPCHRRWLLLQSDAAVVAGRLSDRAEVPSVRAAIRQTADGLAGELPTQAALARFIDEGLLARHIRKAAREYASRHASIVEAIHRDLGRWLRVVPSTAGLHVAARVALEASVDVDLVVRRAQAWGILMRTLSSFSAEGAVHDGFVIGYGAIPAEKINEGDAPRAMCRPVG